MKRVNENLYDKGTELGVLFYYIIWLEDIHLVHSRQFFVQRSSHMFIQV